ncbi:hypothetical protein TRFO_18332 [Tritrichomonas foetus]|uniref:Uncharacterized protein n=1 Tax=Tritrichomonas foetus TaxID=1144522 RepID=A0A1J4KLZ6_9EUKA|nr:hypothetical protein TRFO_18332 [Tritrichomonas foetus]|eukprot:OHT11960.1 hypothetical protein TRFO_18332 [Tritrichomonas foetus]
MSVILPSWLNSRIFFLKSQGRLNLSGEKRTDLSALSHPEIEKLLFLMKILDVSKTDITSLDGLSFYKGLAHFYGDYSQISTLRNFRNLRSVTSISLIGTPVSEHPNYKLSLLLVVGQSLKLIDGKLIPKNIRKNAKHYSPIAIDLINAGWMAEWPCPPIDELIELSEKFNIVSSPVMIKPIDIEIFDEDRKKNLYTGEFESTLRKLKKRHEETLKRGQALFGILEDSSSEEEMEEENDEVCDEVSGEVCDEEIAGGNNEAVFNNEIADVLHRKGVELENDQNGSNDDVIVDAVKSLCAQKKI